MWGEGQGRAEHLGAHGVVVPGTCERAAQLGDLASGLIDGDDVSEGATAKFKEGTTPLTTQLLPWSHGLPGLDLVLGQGLNHLGTQVIDGLHLCGLEGQFAHLGSLRVTNQQMLRGLHPYVAMASGGCDTGSSRRGLALEGLGGVSCYHEPSHKRVGSGEVSNLTWLVCHQGTPLRSQVDSRQASPLPLSYASSQRLKRPPASAS